jgi:tetratricopeptide (TPR) repeat protein
MTEAQVNTILLAANSLAANPMDPALHVALGMACFDANRLDDALASFQQALMLNPDTAQAHYGIGRINDVPNPQAAIAAYERAIALAPHDTEPIYRLGVLYAAGLGEYTNAVATFQRGLAHNANAALLIAGLGSTYARMGCIDAAIDLLQQAVAQQPDLIVAQEWLSILYLHRKRYTDAMATCRSEIALRDAHSPRRLLGYLYEWMGRYAEAIRELEQSIALDPSDYEARAALAKVYRLAGQSDAAVEQYAIAKALALQDDEYGQACFAAVSGDTERALALLEVALAAGQLQRGWARIDPEFAFVSDDPRFKRLVESV